MRRPVCLFGLAFVVIWSILLSAFPRQTDTWEVLDKQRITVAGVVESKEYKLQNEKEILVVSVKQVCVLQPEEVSYLQQILSESDNYSEGMKKWKQYLAARNESASTGVTSQEAAVLHDNHAVWQRTNTMSQSDIARSASGVASKSDVARGASGVASKSDIKRDADNTDSITGLLCYVEKGKEPAIGSIIIASGKFRPFSHATNPGEFDSADYYQINQIQGRLMQSTLAYQSSSCNSFREALYQCKSYLGLLLDVAYPADKATIMRAMLLGEKGTLDPDVKALYQQNGIIHILAISGLHLSILGMGLFKLLHRCYLPKKINVTVCIIFMYCYGVMMGMGVSLRRALIMFAIHLGASLWGRTYDMLTAMAIAAVSILFLQPWYLTHSGFLFSFSAICGIGILLPAMEQNRLWNRKWINAIVSGVGISISTLPVYLWFYYEVPPYSVLLNLLVIPCMTVIMVSGVGTLLLSALFLPFGRITAIPGTILLALYEKCCELCKSLPSHKWITGCPQKWQIVLFVLILAAVIAVNAHLTKAQFWQGILVALMVLTMRFYGGLEITMVDVGQGDCIYVSDGRTSLLIDGGSSDKQAVASYQILPFLKYRGVDYLDAVFVTHPDSDHENGIIEMLESYEDNGITIAMLLLPDMAESVQNEEYHKLQQLAEQAAVAVCTIKQGDRFGRGLQTGEYADTVSEIAESGKNNRKVFGKLSGEEQRIAGDAGLIEGEEVYDKANAEAGEKAYEEANTEAGEEVYEEANTETGEEVYEEANAKAGEEVYEEANAEAGEAVYEEANTEAGGEVYEEANTEAGEEMYEEANAEAGEAVYKETNVEVGNRMGRQQKIMLTCLHPLENYQNQDTNACSTVLYLQYGDFTALFTGDLEGEGESLVLEELRRNQIQKIDLLKVAHHGSKNSSNQEFLSLVCPQIAIISAGRGNSYGHPHQETLERLEVCGASHFCTQDYGAITVKVTRRGEIQVEGYQK